MAEVIATQIVAAPLSQVWDSWDDFGAIQRFNPNLNGSHLINNSAATGKGAMRQCDLSDGKNYIRERVIGYEPQKSLTIDVYEGSLPLKRAVVTFLFQATAPDTTEVTMKMAFEPKMGLLGKLMIPMMKPQLRKMMARLLDGNAAFVERGVEVVRAAA